MIKNNTTELIKINYDSDRPTVLARDLHKMLEVKSKFNDFFNRMISYGFTENEDYILVAQKKVTNNPKNPISEYIDYQLTTDMAFE